MNLTFVFAILAYIWTYKSSIGRYSLEHKKSVAMKYMLPFRNGRLKGGYIFMISYKVLVCLCELVLNHSTLQNTVYRLKVIGRKITDIFILTTGT